MLHIALILLLSSALGGVPSRSYAAGLECPDLGSPATASHLLTDLQARVIASGNSVDLANEIDDLINKLQSEQPNISRSDMTDIIIAAFCPVVANLANLSTAEKWRRMRQLDMVLQQQVASMMPGGSLIIASVPLTPPVYRELRAQAASVGQTPAQLMTAILSRAAGK